MCTDPLDSPNEETLKTTAPSGNADQGISGNADIAIIGMTGRFPGAATLASFWENLCAGRHAITFFDKDELRAAGVPETMLALPNYVRAAGTLAGCDLFDAGFFGMSPSEAEIIDPQHRLFLEMAWQVLEEAGYDPFQYPGAIGLFAGSGPATYLMNNLAPNIQQLGQRMGLQQLLNGNDKDFMPLRVAYKLDLRGPTLNVQSACSTSLVAVHMGCQSLINGECDLVLAGGIRVSSPIKAGYLYQEGQIASPDGLCRPFDADAEGTIGGSGGGVIAMKMLNQAVEDGDRILAIIKGSAVNNDGNDKISFTAPSVEGQAAAIREAMAVGYIDPETVTFVETHGTATPVGDPIEIAALRQAFGETEQTAFCALTSTKANIGHLDAGAGIAGLIKAVLVLQNKQIPPSAHFEKPNSKIPFENGPFFVNQTLRDWQRTDPEQPLRAGVSSFGMGGTNAHVVLEEAPTSTPSDPAKPWLIFPISAKTASALDQRVADLHQWLLTNAGNPADLAFTLQQGRAAFAYRTAVVASHQEMLTERLARPDQLQREYVGTTDRPLIFMFTGQGAQQIHMGRDLYDTEAIYRETIDFCAEQLLDLGFGEGLVLVDKDGTRGETLEGVLDLRDILYPTREHEERAKHLMRQTAVAQVALFSFEYALACLWSEWGIAPQAMIGHSLGEYVAATLAEVMTPEEALFLIEQRGRLMQGLPAGAMLAVRLDETQVASYLCENVSLAVVNGPGQSVVSGTINAVNALEVALKEAGVTFRRLDTSHAFHSPMMEPILAAFEEILGEIELREPRRRYISNLTGTWIEAQEATSPAYWRRHLRETVRFHAGLETLLDEPSSVFLEIGPGTTLSNLVKRHPMREKHQPAIASQPKISPSSSALSQVLQAVSELWKIGIAPDWHAFHRHARRQRLALPTYPFQRQRFWIDPPQQKPLLLSVEPRNEPKNAVIPGYERPELQTTFAEPESDQEKQIAAIWGNLLAIKQVGRHDDFLDLGGDSLVITQIHARLRKAFDLDLPLQPLFDLNTIADQAAWVADLKATGNFTLSADNRDVAALAPAPRERQFPLSFAQQRLWILDKIEGSNPAYHMPAVLQLEGQLDLSALEATFTEIARRHEIMRTAFPDRDGIPHQIVSPPEAVVIEVHMRETHSENLQSELTRDLGAFLARPFDLGRAPCFRVALFRLAPKKHILAAVQHHIISDGWSIGVLVRELGVLYPAALKKAPLETLLPPLQIQYADFAIWQRGWLEGDAWEGQITYWREKLAGLPPHIDLPTDRPHPALQTFAGAMESLVFDKLLSDQLRAFAKASKATLFMVLKAAFATLMHRYSHQRDIAIGTPIANRTRQELEPMVGCFINTLVLRASFNGNPDFHEVVARTRQTAHEAYAHQDVPFEEVVEAIQPQRDLSRNPLFQVMFILQNTPASELALPQLKIKPFLEFGHFAKFEIQVDVHDLGDAFACHFEYNTDLFDAQTMQRMAHHFQALTQALIEHPDVPVAELAFLEAEERHRMITTWNDTRQKFDLEWGIHQLFERQAEKMPQALALGAQTAGGFRDVTYAELNQRADALAHQLRALAAGPDVTIGMACERSLEMMVALLGILKSGAAYVPMDPTFPAERLAWIAKDSGLKIIITRANIPKTVTHLVKTSDSCEDIQLIRLDPSGSVLDLQAPKAKMPATRFAADSLAYVIYTSGSTGRPKGVQLSHRSVVNFLCTMAQKPGLTQKDILLAVTTISFDIAGLELYLPLMVGAQVVLATTETAASSAELIKLLAESDASVMQATPATWQMLIASDWIGDSHLKILCGGEALPSALAKKLLGRCHSLWNMYGPTETTIWSTILNLDARACEAANLSIGHPIGNTTAFILDQSSRLVPIGIPGHLHLGGSGLARGYRNRPALTAEKFIPNPFAEEPGSRLYATGDQVRYQADGRLMYLGRFDHQIKLRGFRIELGEIEAVLAHQPGVEKAVVVVREDRPGDQRLVAYVVAEGGLTLPDQASLRNAMAAQVPIYMLPSAIVELADFPMTPNRKIDRRALPAPALPDKSTTSPLRNPTQELIASIWADVLHLEDLGSDAHFFALGGHSLLAAQVIARVRKKLHAELPISALFEAPTVAGFSQRVAQAVADPEAMRPEMIIQPRVDEGPWRFPLSSAQQQLWLFQQITDDSTPYHMPFTLRIDGPLAVAALEAAFRRLIERHEPLRTTFESYHGIGLQVVHPVQPWHLDMDDLTDIYPQEQQDAVFALTSMHARKPFDLGKGPLFRVHLLKLSPEQHLVLLNQHHIISDAWSLGNLASEIIALYTSFVNEKPSPLADLALQYADFSIWQQQWFQSGLSDRLTDYWRNKLGNLPALQPLPLGKSRPETTTLNPGITYFQLSESLVEGIHHLGREEGVTVFIVLLASLNALTAFHTQTDDVVIGTDVANRDFQEQEPLIGFFVNQIVLRTQLGQATTFKEVLALTRETVLQGYAHQQLPFDQVISMVNPERKPHVNPLFQMKLVLQNVPVEAKTVDSLTFTPLPQEPGLAKFDLLWNMEERDGRIFCDMQFNQDLYTEHTCARLGGHLTHLLEQVVQHPELPLASIQFLLERFDSEAKKQSQADLQSTRTNLLKKAKRRRC